MKKLLSLLLCLCMAVSAAAGAMAAAAGPAEERGIATDGLVGFYDGKQNTAGGHDAKSAVWADLSGHGNDIALTLGDNLSWEDDALYVEKLNELYDTLSELAAYAKARGVDYVGIEQMYSPHQPPWRIADAEELMREVYRRSGAPFYITADLGHMNGQQYFLRPDAEYIEAAILRAREGTPARRLWLGSVRAHDLYKRAVAGETGVAAAVRAILEDVAAHPHLFAEPTDASNDAWVRRTGCYSPIIHLQQTDGKSSPHWTFTPENNRNGIVKPEAFLRALKAAYLMPDDPAMPPKCGEITLTFEPFIATAGNTFDLLDDIAESVRCWRRWIPRDGMRLHEIEL